MYKSKLIKISGVAGSRIKNNEVLDGHFFEWPSVDKRFQFIVNHSSLKIDFSSVWPITTSLVTEVIDIRTFKTMNSIYKLVLLEDERNEKIEKILK